MIITIEKFIEDLKNDRMGHYVYMYVEKSYTLAVYIENGFAYGANTGQIKEFNKWCNENCNGDWRVYNEFWVVFELDSDAIAFKLRWI